MILYSYLVVGRSFSFAFRLTDNMKFDTSMQIVTVEAEKIKYNNII